ncbi:MAG: hypothetical protein Q9220_004799 [cf. Caloplaca sp. 1 TL-2023]
MPTNRPFFANFLAAFRAQSAFPKASPTTPCVTTTASQTSQFSIPSAARTIVTTNTTPHQHQSSLHPDPHKHSSSPPSSSLLQTTKSPTSPPATLSSATAAATAHHPLSHLSQHPTSPPSTRSPRPFTRAPPHRRGSDSDSSSDGGFREVLGGEKWYIGGRTATGEEKFYRMGMVRREKSLEGGRSFDRLSL